MRQPTPTCSATPLAPLEGAGNSLVATYNNGPFVNGSFVDTTIDANVCPGNANRARLVFPPVRGAR